MAAATVFACWDGQKRALRGTPATVQELAAAVRAAHGWSEGALLQFSVSIPPAQTEARRVAHVPPLTRRLIVHSGWTRTRTPFR
jgi:hypothetical protein